MWRGIKNIYHLFNAFLANLWFGFPSRNLIVVGVTGTDGKTTTVSLIYHILNKAGFNTSMISSVGAIIGGKDYNVGFHVTTPSSWALQRFLRKAQGSPRPLNDSSDSSLVQTSILFNYLVLEVTSHAIDQNRIWGIPFAVGVLINVTHEHLDYHKTYENYVKTKVKLLKTAKIVVVNKDDESYASLSSKFKVQSSKLITYGMKDADITPQNFPFKTNLIGEFNKYNVLAAISACKSLGISDENIRNGLKSFKPPLGREDVVFDKDFTVMIDFAHTPNAFEQILSSIRSSIKGRLIHVFGAAGQRDASKRPLMGKVSSKYSDVIVLTAEDPRSESIEKIIKEVESGITNSKFKIQNYLAKPDLASRVSSKFKIKDDKNIIFKIPSRQEAINTAIKMARKGDFVLITGKSHERSMNYGHGEVRWDEFEAVKKALKNKYV